ncbi:GntR family transcriptional regulator [Bacillus sp. SD088]|uniref:GntR family transcriptional regulator n=1 Tax=Bacillus sp. SD088 TaxID=2782012 RepID=UPI001A96DAC0|nr:GntR family transcriptional regulator [Bacillus sp. SD088]MBO0995796.1 GntR family transcriptional regulator [Bacillus sp. SD088]
MKSLYEQVYESLKKEILSAKYQVGDQVPSENELSEIFNVSRITSKKALEKLMKEGYVYRQRGRGTFVAEWQVANQVRDVESRKPVIGLIMTTFDDNFGNTLVSSLEEASDDKCFLILKRSLGIPEREEKIIQELLDFGVSGLIVCPAQAQHYTSEILKMVVNQFPLVLIDRAFKGVAAAAVSTDNVEAAIKGINYLIDHGHEHIGVLMSNNYVTTTLEDRLLGIVNAFSENQLVVNRELWFSDIKSTSPIPEVPRKEDIEKIKKYIQKNPKITALFALEYQIASLAKVAVDELGLSVPNDISIICFDSPPINDHEWRFTHLKQDEGKIGRLALERLMDMYYGKFNTDSQLVPATLIEGSTTRTIRTKSFL